MGRKIPTKNLIYILFLTLLISGFFAFFNKSALASSTDGTIDSTYKYAWGENIGWVNFGTSNGNVHVIDSGLSGYALSETVGWINLEDVVNDGQGNLSGYAWGENVGYIKFNPTNGGVTINSSGEFTGSALGENIGWIIFGGDYKVKTDWRPRSARPACNNSSDDDSDGKTDYHADPGCSSLDDTDETDPGGGLPPEAYNPPASPPSSSDNPEGKFGIAINDAALITNDRTVNLKLFAGSDTKKMAISNSYDFSGAVQEEYQPAKTWLLSEGEGDKTVYAKFYTQWGQSSKIISASIVYKIALPEESTAPPPEEKPIAQLPTPEVKPPVEIPKDKISLPPRQEPKKPIIEKVPEVLKPLIPEFLKPKPPETKPTEVPIEELVSKEAPLAFQGKWQLLPSEPIREFVLAPLPKWIRNLAQKFPELEKTLEEVGVSKITDVAKLKSVKLTLPGLTERVGLPTAKVEPGKFALPQGVPVAKLSPAIKQQLPTEIVFAKTGGELVDFNIALSVNDKGEPQQKIATISGKPLQLVVKPDKPVKSVKGYVVFKSKASQPTSLELPRDSLLASVIFAIPVFAKTQDQPVRVEEKLVLLEFEYTDPDGDGIYTAEIQAPLIEGEYEIITVMDFDDPELGKKEIRLTTVVDPEGYIYERDGDKETRIPGAIVSLYWLNPETKQYEMWPAKEYQQENPQTTDVRGTYSFLVPEGYYYLKAETPGYLVYDGKPFQVKEGSGIHINIEFKTKYWWLKIVDWKTILLAVVIILLLYNFYRDKIREKVFKKS